MSEMSNALSSRKHLLSFRNLFAHFVCTKFVLLTSFYPTQNVYSMYLRLQAGAAAAAEPGLAAAVPKIKPLFRDLNWPSILLDQDDSDANNYDIDLDNINDASSVPANAPEIAKPIQNLSEEIWVEDEASKLKGVLRYIS